MIRPWFAVAAVVIGATVASSALLAQAAPEPPSRVVELAIRASLQEMRTAAENLDAEVLFSYVLEAGVPPVIENGEVAQTRSAAMQRTRRGFQGIKSIVYAYTRDSLLMLSATTALWIAEGTASATLDDGRELTVPFAETILLLEDVDQWKVLHAHRSVPNQQ
jgi:hypothetical protein